MNNKNLLEGTLSVVPIREVIPDPNQPRQEFAEDDMKKLNTSIKEKGILSPLVVEPKKNGKYSIIDGERRYRAAASLKMEKVPVNILKRFLNEEEKDIVRFHLQETHTHWSFFEKAEAISKLKDKLQLDNTNLARALGVNERTVFDYLAVLTFPSRIRKLAVSERLPFTYLRRLSFMNTILSSEVKKEVPDFAERVIEKYKKGFLTLYKDLSIINKLIKVGEFEVVIRFFKELTYTAQNALSDSEYSYERHVDSLILRGRNLNHLLKLIHKNKIKIDDTAESILMGLREEINKLIR